ncbi:MAG TPA: hypothetical protein VET90_08435 [Candidatus Binatus sp.]|nr:hypothetical protein [Candidatus Binatus sp.]
MTTRSTDEPTAATSPHAAGDPPRVAIPISAEDARGAIDAVGRRAPEVAEATRDATIETMRWVQAASDDRVATGAALSLGLLIGLVLGGAPRILIAAALTPVALFGLALMDRRARPTK